MPWLYGYRAEKSIEESGVVAGPEDQRHVANLPCCGQQVFFASAIGCALGLGIRVCLRWISIFRAPLNALAL
jgi:hypothetical protein